MEGRRSFQLTLHHLVRSIRFRLALWFAAILAAVLLVFSVFIYARQDRDLNSETYYRLNLKARQLESYFKYNASEYFEGVRTLTPTWGEEQQYWLQEKDILALVNLDGQVVQKVGPIRESDLKEVARVGIAQGIYQNRFSYSVVEASAEGKLIKEKYIFVVAPISANHKIMGSLILGGPVDPTSQMNRLLFTLVLGNLAMLILALVGGYWLANRAMRPVQRIADTAQEISATDLSRRINLGTQDELGALADTFDRMLDRLQAAFDRQRRFTADASHELRTPLTIINLEVERALANRRSAPEYIQALSAVQAENELMTRLVNNLLALSRMDAGQTVLNLELLDLSDITLEVVERLTPLAEGRGMRISTGDLPELIVSGDRQFLGQMISNLVENAIKYSRPSGARPPDAAVWVETGMEAAGPQPFARVSVKDNGLGIAKEHLPYIFDRFYQVDQARSRDTEELENEQPGWQASIGSGLGLSIVQWIAHTHGGAVQVQSEVGLGSTFSVRLPLAQAEAVSKSFSLTGQQGG